ncbi:hypothetical protein [Micromonospora sp. NPDC051296]|uniref:hypothetical protein n=1 Tax=Micromonospora sp. NPDC051296 TaxID=3155046 RepID=UPI003441C9FC
MSARLAAALASAALLAVGTLTVSPAHADTVGKGPNGQRMTASRTAGLPLAGAEVTVSGSGYDTTKGIYVAYCVDNGAGTPPGPCGGGIDTSGASGASHWISSNPPSYGEGLAVPYGSGGSFTVKIKVTARIGDVDCTTRRCVLASRNDHTRSSDRSQDVRVPVTFATATAPTTRAATPAATTRAATAPSAEPTATTGAPAGGAPSATAAASAEAGATVAPAAADADHPVLTTQVSDSSPAGRWFTAALAGLTALLVLLVLLRARSRRRDQR